MGFLGFGDDHGSYTPAAYDNRGATRLNQYATDPSLLNQDTMSANPYLQQLLGKGGAYDDAAGQSKDLLANGFNLNSNDYKAYGQASDNIARQFGQTENNLANSLSSRGFGQAGSGAAGAAFSGLQGNKNEMLAHAQTQIADARMNFAQNALTSTRNFMNQAAGVGNQANGTTAGAMSEGANAYNNGWKTSNDASFAAFGNKQANTNPSFGEVLGGNVSQLLNPVAGARAAGQLLGATAGKGNPGSGPGLGTAPASGGVDPNWASGNTSFPGATKG